MLSVFVPGRPATLTAPHLVAEPWKRKVAEVVGRAWGRPFLKEAVAVELEFRFPGAELSRVALHNLLKATIDGLSFPVFAPGSHGHRTDWNREDGWICELLATKAPGDSGVQISLRSLAPGPDTAPAATVNGRPAPWVTAAEPQWKQAVLAAAIEAGIPTPPRSVLLAFRVEPRYFYSTDLDNLVVPVVAALSPERGSSVEVHRIHAWKGESSAETRGLDLWV